MSDVIPIGIEQLYTVLCCAREVQQELTDDIAEALTTGDPDLCNMINRHSAVKSAIDHIGMAILAAGPEVTDAEIASFLAP